MYENRRDVNNVNERLILRERQYRPLDSGGVGSLVRCENGGIVLQKDLRLSFTE